nr:RNA-directed DNA polymerase, eukaryota, reverse transcriptase zinc-binding domain protein [Tanacetum cinerariifolium]
MKKHIRRLNKRIGNVFDKVKLIKVELSRVQECLDKDPSCSILEEEEMVYYQAYKDAMINEEKLMRQKTKFEWWKEGDANSSYFHNVIKGRVSKNKIKVKLDVEKSMELIKDVSDLEIKEALFNIEDNKASGPDGYSSNLDISAKVIDLIDNNSWSWPIDWVSEYDDVLNVPVSALNCKVEDRTYWCNKKGKEKHFSVSEVWKAIKCEYPKVIWYRHVWFSQCMPRHAFITWLAVKERPKTRDKLTKWFNIQDKSCLLCELSDESHSHLFFSCSYSRRLWERLKPMALLDNVSNIWSSAISGIVIRPAKILFGVRIVFSATVDFIWLERNIRRSKQRNKMVDVLFKVVEETIRLKFMGSCLKCTFDVIKDAMIWNIPMSKDKFWRDTNALIRNDNSYG